VIIAKLAKYTSIQSKTYTTQVNNAHVVLLTHKLRYDVY